MATLYARFLQAGSPFNESAAAAAFIGGQRGVQDLKSEAASLNAKRTAAAGRSVGQQGDVFDLPGGPLPPSLSPLISLRYSSSPPAQTALLGAE